MECAFGEIDLRWGILWRRLQFSLKMNCKVIDACMRLHNFIVDFRDEHLSQSGSRDSLEMDRMVFSDEMRRFLSINLNEENEEVLGVHGGEKEIWRNDEFEPSQGGRPRTADKECEKVGRVWRDKIRDEITRQQLVRPRTNWFRVNNRMFDV